jgi:hypothetical protein
MDSTARGVQKGSVDFDGVDADLVVVGRHLEIEIVVRAWRQVISKLFISSRLEESRLRFALSHPLNNISRPKKSIH